MTRPLRVGATLKSLRHRAPLRARAAPEQSSIPPTAQIASGRVERAEWDDPDDTGRQGSYVRMVHGFRTADWVVRLFKAGTLTKRHVEAARRLRDDDDLMHGGSGADSVTRMQTGGTSQSCGAAPAATKLDAVKRYREARRACGDLWQGVWLLVLANASISQAAREMARSRRYAQHKLVEGMNLLADHYGVER